MITVAARLSQNELDYLAGIAATNKIHKGESNELSLGKAMKALIKWCQLNQVDISKKHDEMNNDMKRMIEHMHIAIPNLMYLSRMQTLLATEELPKEKLTQVRNQAVDYLNKTCGDFQDIQYNQVRYSMNSIGIRSTPITKDKTLWK